MEELKLNKNLGQLTKRMSGYSLDPTKKYIIDLSKEFKSQMTILSAIQVANPCAMSDWWDWLDANDFDSDCPNPTNEFVSSFYGSKPLWKTDYSQGIVVKDKNEEDYFIIMECSDLNTGFKYTQIILTLGGCM